MQTVGIEDFTAGAVLDTRAGPLLNFNAVFTGGLNIPAAGQRTLTLTASDGFVRGIQGATRISEPLTNAPATTTFKGFQAMGANNIRQNPTPQQIVVNFPAAGAYPFSGMVPSLMRWRMFSHTLR